jgi:hypothetical protein
MVSSPSRQSSEKEREGKSSEDVELLGTGRQLSEIGGQKKKEIIIIVDKTRAGIAHC